MKKLRPSAKRLQQNRHHATIQRRRLIRALARGAVKARTEQFGLDADAAFRWNPLT